VDQVDFADGTSGETATAQRRTQERVLGQHQIGRSLENLKRGRAEETTRVSELTL
jgi:hypothetical protein